jgi:hypothetical protein
VIAGALDSANATPTPFPEVSVLRPAPAGLAGSGRHEAGFLVPLIPSGVVSGERERASINATFRGQLAVMELSRFRVPTVWLGIYRFWAADRLYPGFKSVVSICYGFGQPPPARPGLVSRVLGGRRRKPIEDLFYDVENSRPFTQDSVSEALLPWFRAIQWGPSSMNRQSWRFAIDRKNIHVYKRIGPYSLSDIGIATANIHLLAVDSGHKPKFSVVDNPPLTKLGGRYIVSCSFRD